MIQKLRQRFAPLLRILRRVRQFFQILNAREGLRRAFFFKRPDIPGAINQKANQLRQSGRVAGLAKTFHWRLGLRRGLVSGITILLERRRLAQRSRSGFKKWIEVHRIQGQLVIASVKILEVRIVRHKIEPPLRFVPEVEADIRFLCGLGHRTALLRPQPPQHLRSASRRSSPRPSRAHPR